MPTPNSAAQSFLDALSALCRDGGEPVRRGFSIARDVVAQHLGRLAGLPQSDPAPSPSSLETAVVDLLGAYRWSVNEAGARPNELSPLLLQSLFEAGLHGENRRRRGIVYTPPQTVQRVIDAALSELEYDQAESLRIADPAVGSGAFLVQLASAVPERSCLFGLDPDRAALAITGQRLSLVRALAAHRCPEVQLTEGMAQDHLMAAGPFDLVIGNPPYVRHEERTRPHKGLLEEVTAALGWAHQEKCIARLMAGRADLYATFFVLALASVRPGGVVAFVTSDTWLDARFGEDLQALAMELCDRIVIHPENDQRSFGHTGVNTVITVLRRKQQTGSPSVQFMTDARSTPLSTVPTPGKWAARFLRGGRATRRLQEHPLMVPLSCLANLTYGNKPGIRPFFVLPTESASTLVDQQYLRPVLASSKEICTYALEPEALTHQFFVCPHSISTLQHLGHQQTISWITRGASQVTRRGARHTMAGVPWPEVDSVRNNRPEWHSLRLRPPGDFIVPSLLGSRLFVAHNRGRVDNTNAFFHGTFLPTIDPLLGLGLLNASITYLLFEVYGRPKGLGGLNLYGPELRLLPIPDPNRLTLSHRRGIMEAFAAMSARQILPLREEIGGEKMEMPADRMALDELVFDALGWSARERSEAYAELLAMTTRRLEKGRRR